MLAPLLLSLARAHALVFFFFFSLSLSLSSSLSLPLSLSLSPPRFLSLSLSFFHSLQSTQEKKLVSEWCHACRGISQKVFTLARDRPDDLVLVKLDFDANKQLAKALGVRALPSFALFRGADGKLDLFTAGPARAALLREKVERYGAPRCVLSGKIGEETETTGSAPSPELRELLEKQKKEEGAKAAAA